MEEEDKVRLKKVIACCILAVAVVILDIVWVVLFSPGISFERLFWGIVVSECITFGLVYICSH